MKEIFKNFKFLTEYILVCFLFLILNILPLKLSSKIGGVLFKLFGKYSKSHITALTNCKNVFPNLEKNEINNIVQKSWENLGQTIFELGNLKKLFSKKDLIKINGTKNIKDILNNKTPVIFFSIHYANWEIHVPLLDRLGFSIGAIYRHINNELINNFVLKKRTRALKSKNSFYTPKGIKSAKDILEAIKRKKSIFLLIDQKDSAGDNVPFFNKIVKTQTGFLKIARKYNIPIVPIENKRLKDGGYSITFNKPIFHNNLEETDKDMMIKIHTIIEKWIINDPNQWFWQHNRFN